MILRGAWQMSSGPKWKPDLEAEGAAVIKGLLTSPTECVDLLRRCIRTTPHSAVAW